MKKRTISSVSYVVVFSPRTEETKKKNNGNKNETTTYYFRILGFMMELLAAMSNNKCQKALITSPGSISFPWFHARDAT